MFLNMFHSNIKRLFHFAPCFIRPHFPLRHFRTFTHRNVTYVLFDYKGLLSLLVLIVELNAFKVKDLIINRTYPQFNFPMLIKN
jgi:hypothetical protein